MRERGVLLHRWFCLLVARRVFTAAIVFSLAACALACGSATPTAASVPASESVSASESVPASAPEPTSMSVAMGAGQQSSHAAAATIAQDDDCVCCDGSSCTYAVPVSGRVHPVAMPTLAQPNAPPLCGTSCTGPSGVVPAPKPPSLTELSLLRI